MFLLLWRNADGQRCRECGSACVWEHMSPTVCRCILHFDCFICCFRLTVTTREGVGSVFWLDSCCFSLSLLLLLILLPFAILFAFFRFLLQLVSNFPRVFGGKLRPWEVSFLQDVPHLRVNCLRKSMPRSLEAVQLFFLLWKQVPTNCALLLIDGQV